MALVIYDQGYRVQTPVRSIFKPGGVEQLAETSHPSETAGQQDHERDHINQILSRGNQTPNARARQGANAYQQTGGTTPVQEHNRSYIPASLIMSSPVHTVLQGNKIQAALYKMRQFDISHLVVLSTTGRMMGIVTEKLLLEYLSIQGPTGHSIEDNIEGCYSNQIITATPDTNIRQLAVSCVEHHLTCIPIVEEHGHLAGVITRTDLLQSLINNEWLDSRTL